MASDSPINGEPAPPGDILVVDDEARNLIAMEASLEPLGARVLLAESGDAALRILLEREVALILLDVRMPNLDGFEVARIIRARSRSKRTPIIFITAFDRDESQIRTAYELGIVDFLFKPVVPEILRAKAGVFIDLARQRELVREHEHREHLRTLELERKAWQEQGLQRQMEQLAELDRRKEEFLAVLAHELRNPLAPLVTGLDRLGRAVERDPKMDPAVARTRKMMLRQVEHLTRLVDDLLDVARINSGKLELQIAATSIQDVIAQAVSTSRPRIDAGEHDLVLDVPAEHLSINGDFVRLVQVVTNLLNNAARYTSPRGTICLRCRRVDGHVELRVEDNGRGIPAELLPQVFGTFVQHRDHRSGGLGLGLSIAHRIVTLHRGTITIESEGTGRGTQAIVRLPLDAELLLDATEDGSPASESGRGGCECPASGEIE